MSNISVESRESGGLVSESVDVNQKSFLYNLR